MATTPRTFAETRALDEDALRRLMRGGDPLARVLACWRWMVRGHLLATSGDDGPDAGLRTLLLLNLASAGDVEALTVAARHDPDPAVRDNALAWLWRVAPDTAAEVRRVRLAEEREVEVAVALQEQAPQVDRTAARAEFEAALVHPDVARRSRAYDMLIAMSPDRLLPSVREAVQREDDEALRDRVLARWAASESYWQLLKATRRNPRLTVAGYRALIASGRRFAFETLLPLAASAGADIPLTAIGPPLRDKLRGWLTRRIHMALNQGRDPQAELDLLAQAYQERERRSYHRARRPPLDAYSHEDTAIAALFGPPPWAGSTVPLSRIRRFVHCPSPHLRMLAVAYLERCGAARHPAAREPPRRAAVATMTRDAILRSLVAGADDRPVLEALDPRDRGHRDIAVTAIEALITARILAALDGPPATTRYELHDLDAIAGEEIAGLVLGLLAEQLGGLERPDDRTLRAAIDFVGLEIADADRRDLFHRCWAANQASARVDRLLDFLAQDIPLAHADDRRAAAAERARLAALRRRALPRRVDVALELADLVYDRLLA